MALSAVVSDGNSGGRDEGGWDESFKEFPILSFSVAPSTLRPCMRWVTVMNGIQFILELSYVAARRRCTGAARSPVASRQLNQK